MEYLVQFARNFWMTAEEKTEADSLLRCGMTNKNNQQRRTDNGKGDEQTTATAKNRQRQRRRTDNGKDNGKGQYGDSGCARMTTRGGLRQNDDVWAMVVAAGGCRLAYALWHIQESHTTA